MSTKTAKIGKDETVDKATESVNEAPAAEPKAPKTVTGEVSCKEPSLNVRKEPSMNGEILCTIPVGTQVRIDLELSTEDWYKIRAKKGVDGFCMKKYIATK